MYLQAWRVISSVVINLTTEAHGVMIVDVIAIAAITITAMKAIRFSTIMKS